MILNVVIGFGIQKFFPGKKTAGVLSHLSQVKVAQPSIIVLLHTNEYANLYVYTRML